MDNHPAVRPTGSLGLFIRSTCAGVGVLATLPAVTVAIWGGVQEGAVDALMFGILFMALLAMPFALYFVFVRTLTLSVLVGVLLAGLAVWTQWAFWSSDSSTAGLAFVGQVLYSHLMVVVAIPIDGLVRSVDKRTPPGGPQPDVWK